MDNLPQDPYILVSSINMQLRDNMYDSLESLCNYFGKDINTADLMTAVKAIWTGELGRKEEEIKDITLYLKPEENSAYYVINGEETGRIGL